MEELKEFSFKSTCPIHEEIVLPVKKKKGEKKEGKEKKKKEHQPKKFQKFSSKWK